MALTTLNIAWSGQGPSATGQVFADGVQPGLASSNMDGIATITLDGAATTGTLGFIDGSQTLSFTPRAAFVARSIQSTDTGLATITISALGGAVTNVGVPITLSAAGTNGQTVSAYVRIVR